MGDKESSSSSLRKNKRSARANPRRFADFLVFGLEGTVCLGLFICFYAFVLATFWPLLMASSPADNSNLQQSQQQQVDHLHLPPSLQQAHVPGQEKLKAFAGNFKKKLQELRQGRGVTDAALLEQAKEEFEKRRQAKQKINNLRNAINLQIQNNAPAVAGSQRQGFVVLGMHRSGTSMLSGLLHTSCGYNVGGPLIGSAFDNEKGFFERIDVVLQNDEFMGAQGVWWSANVISYDWERALKDMQDGTIEFKHGKTGLAFLNNPKNAPWLQKDPRMCITLKTWLKLMTNEPAVVFTYRHPLEVAMSLKKREQNFPLEKGLRLWIVYNMRAIQNSKGLCIVRSSNDAILENPMQEVQRISDELTSKCQVPEPPSRLSQEDVNKFIDPSLQHNKRQRALEEKDKEVIATYNNGQCVVYNYESDLEDGSLARKREAKLYEYAMKIYCDFQSVKAYQDDYEWPRLA